MISVQLLVSIGVSVKSVGMNDSFVIDQLVPFYVGVE